MKRKWLRFYRMSPLDKILLARAAGLLVLYSVSLRLLGPKRALILSTTPVNTGRRGGVDPSFPLRASTAAKRASSLLHIGTCLTRSLVVRKLMSSAGIDAVVRVGARRSDRGLDAHAWVEHEAGTVGKDPDGVAYAAFPGGFQFEIHPTLKS